MTALTRVPFNAALSHRGDAEGAGHATRALIRAGSDGDGGAGAGFHALAQTRYWVQAGAMTAAMGAASIPRLISTFNGLNGRNNPLDVVPVTPNMLYATTFALLRTGARPHDAWRPTTAWHTLLDTLARGVDLTTFGLMLGPAGVQQQDVIREIRALVPGVIQTPLTQGAATLVGGVMVYAPFLLDVIGGIATQCAHRNWTVADMVALRANPREVLAYDAIDAVGRLGWNISSAWLRHQFANALAGWGLRMGGLLYDATQDAIFPLTSTGVSALGVAATTTAAGVLYLGAHKLRTWAARTGRRERHYAALVTWVRAGRPALDMEKTMALNRKLDATRWTSGMLDMIEPLVVRPASRGDWFRQQRDAAPEDVASTVRVAPQPVAAPVPAAAPASSWSVGGAAATTGRRVLDFAAGVLMPLLQGTPAATVRAFSLFDQQPPFLTTLRHVFVNCFPGQDVVTGWRDPFAPTEEAHRTGQPRVLTPAVRELFEGGTRAIVVDETLILGYNKVLADAGEHPRWYDWYHYQGSSWADRWATEQGETPYRELDSPSRVFFRLLERALTQDPEGPQHLVLYNKDDGNREIEVVRILAPPVETAGDYYTRLFVPGAPNTSLIWSTPLARFAAAFLQRPALVGPNFPALLDLARTAQGDLIGWTGGNDEGKRHFYFNVNYGDQPFVADRLPTIGDRAYFRTCLINVTLAHTLPAFEQRLREHNDVERILWKWQVLHRCASVDEPMFLLVDTIVTADAMATVFWLNFFLDLAAVMGWIVVVAARPIMVNPGDPHNDNREHNDFVNALITWETRQGTRHVFTLLPNADNTPAFYYRMPVPREGDGALRHYRIPVPPPPAPAPPQDL